MNNSNENTQDAGLLRYAAVCQIQQLIEQGVSMTRSLALCAQKTWGTRSYSAGTLEKWYYRYRNEGYQGLKQIPRKDKGESRALDSSFKETVSKLRMEKPELTVTSCLRELEKRGEITRASYSLSSVYRFLNECSLDRQSLKRGLHQRVGGPTKAFEMGRVNELWMADAMVGVPIRSEQGKVIKTSLMALIDDHSRLVVHAQYYGHEKAWCFLDTLKKAIRRRGIPEKLYTDNGKVFTGTHLQQVCANLGMRLSHAKPYHAWSKGKIERFFLTVQSDFEQSLQFDRVDSLERLNERFWVWLEQSYNQKTHSSLNGQSPAERFRQCGEKLRLATDESELERLFLKKIQRTVRKDCTISIHGTLWEVPVYLRSHKVDVHFDPFELKTVGIYQKDKRICAARPCDKTINAHHFSSYNYEK